MYNKEQDDPAGSLEGRDSLTPLMTQVKDKVTDSPTPTTPDVKHSYTDTIVTILGENIKSFMVEDQSLKKCKLDDTTSACQNTSSSDVTTVGSESETSERSACPSLLLPAAGFLDHVTQLQKRVDQLWDTYCPIAKKIFYALLVLAYGVYLTLACLHDLHKALPLLITTALVAMVLIYHVIKIKCGRKVTKVLIDPMLEVLDSKWYIIKWPVYGGVLPAIVCFLLLSVGTEPRQYKSLGGMVVFLLLLFIFSKHPAKVNPRPVLWGLLLQFLIAVMVLRTRWGFMTFQLIGQKMQDFLAFTNSGSVFVFGPRYEDHMFAFKVLPVIIFFSASVSVLYYLGVMQTIISKIAWLMQKTLQTSATESLVAAGNIFIGQTEAPILVRPFIKDMTRSEMHAIMTAGYATIAGSVLAAYILFGVPAEHLICASVMNAPMALAVSKLFYPETEVSSTRNKHITLPKSEERNIMEAASTGVSDSISLVANIAANLIAFIALLAFVNAVVSWCGELVGHPEWTFQMLCSYMFLPFAYLMGVEWGECLKVAELLGIKTFLNEFVAYEELSKLIHNRKACVEPHLSVRSEVIATYALCGFSNLSSVGVQIGGIGAMAPSRRSDVAAVAVRAMIAGTTVCFITACVAGVLVVPDPSIDCPANVTMVTSTMATTNNLTLLYSLLPYDFTS